MGIVIGIIQADDDCRVPVRMEVGVTGSAVEGPMLLVKKLGGLVFVVMGLLGFASGYYYGSGWLILAGILSLGIGMGLLAIKVIRRNAGR